MQDAAITRRLISVAGTLLAATLFVIVLGGRDAHAAPGARNHPRATRQRHAAASRPAARSRSRRATSTAPSRVHQRSHAGARSRRRQTSVALGSSRGGHAVPHEVGGSPRATGGATLRAAATSGPVAGANRTSHRDPRDPGSCQELGRGNAGDIDPYRGPDAAGNDPARGNDCDEGGGNNRGSYPRRTNTHNAGDSDVDHDRGAGNNRCGRTLPSTGHRPDPGHAGNGPAAAPPAMVGSAIYASSGQRDVAPARVLDEVREQDRAGGGAIAHRSALVRAVQAAAGRLPFTGLGLGWLALAGGLLVALGVGLRRLPSMP